MRRKEEPTTRPRKPVLPRLSSRTLRHPSFLPLYMAADFGHRRGARNGQTVHPIIPAEFFYTDPTGGCGRRMPNAVTDLRVLDCLQLNTPPPVMSCSLAPPNRPDPFRFGPHSTRGLGSATWSMLAKHHAEQPRRAILELTQEEDQAVTNLLGLHYQSPSLSDEEDLYGATGPPQGLTSQRFQNPEHVASVRKPLCGDAQQRGGWSDAEREAADILSSGFILWGQNEQKPVASCGDGLPHQSQVDLSVGQNDPGWLKDVVPADDDGLVRGASPAQREPTCSDLERNAVSVLLSLADRRTRRSDRVRH